MCKRILGEDRDLSNDSSSQYDCRFCRKHLDSFGDMQRHELVEHVQKGNFEKRQLAD